MSRISLLYVKPEPWKGPFHGSGKTLSTHFASELDENKHSLFGVLDFGLSIRKGM